MRKATRQPEKHEVSTIKYARDDLSAIHSSPSLASLHDCNTKPQLSLPHRHPGPDPEHQQDDVQAEQSNSVNGLETRPSV